MQSKTFNIAIVPTQAVAQKAERASRQAKGFFLLDGKTKYPHVTVYMAEYPAKNISQLKKIVSDLAKNAKSFNLKAQSINLTIHGYFDVSFFKSAAIKKLHKAVIQKANKFRINSLNPEYKKRFKDFSAIQKKNAKIYGYHDLLSLYRPHLTFSKIAGTKKPKIGFKPNDFSFRANRIALFEAGPHGTAVKLIKLFNIR